MNKKVIIIGAIVLGVIGLIVHPYNKLVTLQGTIENEAWPNVETQYQRRYDLIPNMVNTVKGYAAHEGDVFKSITEARSGWQGASRSAKMDAIPQMESAISRLLLTVENYPNLKADTSFLNLQTTLEGTENRITTARIRYNGVVKDYNIYKRKFPVNITSSLFGFENEEPFKLQNNAAASPVNVEF